jgi:hypothetical protein
MTTAAAALTKMIASVAGTLSVSFLIAVWDLHFCETRSKV